MMGARFVAVAAFAAGCGPGTRGPVTLAEADYKVQKAPDGPLKDEALTQRESVMSEWVRAELVRANDALTNGDPKEAFGIATSLHEEALKRGLPKLDASTIQPVIEKAVMALLPTMASEPRTTAAGLLGYLDAAHDSEARVLAAKPFAAKVTQYDAAARDADAKGDVPAAYLYHALADYYAFRKVDANARKRRNDSMDPLAGLSVRVDPVSNCEAFETPINKMQGEHGGEGVEATIHVTLDACELGKTTADEVTQEERRYQKRVGSGGSHTEGEAGHYVDKAVVDSSGNVVYTTGTGVYNEGNQHTVQNPDIYAETEITVDVHHVTLAWRISGKIRASVPGGASVEEPLSYFSSYDDEYWKVPAGDEASGFGKSIDSFRHLQAEIAAKDAVYAALDAARRSVHAELGRKFLEAAKGATNPDEKLAGLVKAVYAGSLDAGVELGTLLNERPGDVSLAMEGVDVSKSSSLAKTMDPPPGATAAEKAWVDAMFQHINMRRTSEGHGAVIQFLAGIQTSKPTRYAPGQGQMSADPSGSYGVGIGLHTHGGVEPGREENSVLAGIAMDLRLGYAGGLFIDGNLPVWVGYRYAGIGLATEAMFGWNKLGKDEASDLWVRNSPYVGFGLKASYITLGSYDFAGSVDRIYRSSRWQETDPFAAVIPPVISDEVRYSFQVARFTPPTGPYARGYVNTVEARLSTFTGDQKDGYAFTLWLGYYEPR